MHFEVFLQKIISLAKFPDESMWKGLDLVHCTVVSIAVVLCHMHGTLGLISWTQQQ